MDAGIMVAKARNFCQIVCIFDEKPYFCRIISEMIDMKVAIIGAGHMGGAIAKGLALGKAVAPEGIWVSNPSQGKLDWLKEEIPGMNVTSSNQEAATGAEYVYLAVKPWLVGPVLRSLKLKKGQALVSVAAGITFEALSGCLPHKDMAMFRIVPNTAARALQSMTLIASRNATDGQCAVLAGMLDGMGRTMFIDEAHIAAATALCSCGIAYVMKYVQACVQAGIELGIRPADGQKLVAQTLKGAASLLEEPDADPAKEIEAVCTPGGYTIRGINQLDHDGFPSAVIRALKASMPSTDINM